MSKTVNGTTTNQVWDLAEGLPTIIQDGSTKEITGPGGLPIEQVASDGTALYYLQDQLGSTRGLTDSSGSIVATFSYDAYGNLTSSTGTATTPFQYAGQYADSESGLQYLRARYYDPQTAQFLMVDPLVGLTQQPYGYAAGDPLNWVDWSGMDCSLGFGVGRTVVDSVIQCGEQVAGEATAAAQWAARNNPVRPPDYFTASGSWYGLSASVVFSRDGKVFGAYGLGNEFLPGVPYVGGLSDEPGIFAGPGWALSGQETDCQIDNMLTGQSVSVGYARTVEELPVGLNYVLNPPQDLSNPTKGAASALEIGFSTSGQGVVVTNGLLLPWFHGPKWGH